MYNGAESYFEDGVLSADPVELVRMLYRGGIDAVEKARQHLREGDIAARSAQISRAGAIIAHLTFSVNRDADPSMGANLVELYDYMQRRLLRANLEQSDAPLGEVSRLLSTLLDAWAACGPIEVAAAETTPTWAPAETEPVETAGADAGAYGQPIGAGTHADASGAGWYGQAAGAGAPGQTEDFSVSGEAGGAAGTYAQPAGAGAGSQTVDALVYSPTPGAEAHVPASAAGAYRQTVAAGGYGEQEEEVEYAGKSWDF